MQRIAGVALALGIFGCAGPAMDRSPTYDLGFSDGCATASAQGPGVPRAPKRDEMLYAKDADYRAGWSSGNLQCRNELPNRL